ncbi:hypothetical protein BS47DRAFT_397772 [Hydnum rufescens UP504]|uniref:C2H2-type domain-containing protein n=1 Tax=Hydnum rufescens UP504 TaxID=1448309 RepID=A0A9P6BAT7_9AGAM|nr:hypothetical protein BS47DRAFT_397772 [Hydnum rufescens UP504]
MAESTSHYFYRVMKRNPTIHQVSISPTTTVHPPRIRSHKEESTHESEALPEDHALIPSKSSNTSAKRDVRDSSSLSLIQSLSPPIEAIRSPKLSKADATSKPKAHPQLSKSRRPQRNHTLPPMQNEGSQPRTLSVMEPLVLMPLKDLRRPSSTTSQLQILKSPQSSQKRSPSPAETLREAAPNNSPRHAPVSSGSTPSRLQPYIELVPRSALKPRVEVLTISSDEDEPALETFYGSLRPVVCNWAYCGSILASITYLENHLKKRHRKDLKDSLHPTCQWALCNHRYPPFLDSRSLVRHILNDHIPQVSFCHSPIANRPLPPIKSRII